MNEKTAVVALAALAQETRLRIFRALIGAGPAGLTPSSLSAMLGLTGSNLSFHLKELARADLVTVERDGRQLFYRPNVAHMTGLVGYLVDHCCQGRDCSPSPRRAKRWAAPACG